MKRGHDVESAPSIWRRRTAMEHYAGIDVSLELSSVCVVDAQGKIVKEAKVASEPEAVVAFFGALGFAVSRQCRRAHRRWPQPRKSRPRRRPMTVVLAKSECGEHPPRALLVGLSPESKEALFSRSLPTPSAAASSQASRRRAATSPVLSIWRRPWPASGWGCSRRSRRASPGTGRLCGIA